MAACILSFLLLPTSVHAQDSFLLHHYTNENGLPSNSITGMVLDKNSGFLWIGTQGGLVRFDGREFKRTISDNSPRAASRITTVCRNREGTIYCEDDNFALYRIHGNQTAYVTIDSILIPNYTGGAFPVKSLVQLTQTLKKLDRSSFLPVSVVYPEEAISDSSFFFLYQEDGYYYNARKDTLVRLPGVNGVLKMNNEVLFVRTDGNLWRYDDSPGLFVPVRVKAMPAFSAKGKRKPRYLWTPGMQEPVLVHSQDMWKLEGSGSILRLTPICRNCLPNNAGIRYVQIWEEQGMIFLGSETNGLYILKHSFLHTLRKDTTVEAAKAQYAQAEVSPGAITTATGFSFSLKGEKLRDRPKLSFTHNIYQNAEGDCWFHTSDTIIHYYRKEDRRVNIPTHNAAGKMVFAETQGRVFVVADEVIADITDDRYRPLYKLTESSHTLKNRLNPDAAIEWTPGVLAIATEKLVFFNTEKPAKLDTVPIPRLTVKVRALFKYGQYLLIGTYGQGFYMYKNGIVKKMPLDKNRYLSAAHCFLPDDKGFCWISTNHGLFKASLSALVAAYEHNLHEIYYQYFGKDDGIFNTEFNGGCQPCAIRTSEGAFSFPTMNGIVLFDPLRRTTPPPPGNLFIDEIKVDSLSYLPGDSNLTRLPYTTTAIRFDLALSQFGNPESIYFSYHLEPYDGGWQSQDITKNGSIHFGGLRPGTYILTMRIRNGFEPDQFRISCVSFRILAPWYHTWWFCCLCGLAFLLLLWRLAKWRTMILTRRKNQLQQQVFEQTKDIEAQNSQLETHLVQLQEQKERLEADNDISARLIAVISHDIISPLNFLTLMGRKLQESVPVSDPSSHIAGLVVSVAQDLGFLSRNILDWIRFHYESVQMHPERFHLRDLVMEFTDIPSTLAREKGLAFHNDTPVALELHQYRQALGVIIYNLTINAVKYTAAGEVRIDGRSNQEKLWVSVRDTGPGISPEIAERLKKAGSARQMSARQSGYSPPGTKTQLGFLIVNDLLRLIGGSLAVETVPNGGTSITIELPVANPAAWP